MGQCVTGGPSTTGFGFTTKILTIFGAVWDDCIIVSPAMSMYCSCPSRLAVEEISSSFLGGGGGAGLAKLMIKLQFKDFLSNCLLGWSNF